MRDIRTDLKERLSKIEGERQDLKARLDALNRQELTLKTLIEQEDNIWASQQDDLFMGAPPPVGKARTELGTILMSALADARPRPLEDLKRIAVGRGFDFNGKQPGRVIHFALLGMAQNGEVEMAEKGVWKLKTEHVH